MIIFKLWAWSLVLLYAAAATEPVYLLEEIADRPDLTAPISRGEAMSELSKAKLISLGETHDRGMERDVLAELFMNLASQAPPTEKCLVELYPTMVEGVEADDPVRLNHSKLCSSIYSSEGPRYSFYQEPLKQFLKLDNGRPVVTHTGFRHILPFGLLYPADFKTHALDKHPEGTITLQLPPGFIEKKLKMRSHSTLALDHVITRMIENELHQGASPESIDQRLSSLMPRLGFSSSEKVKTYELKRVEQSYPHHRAFLSLIDHKVLTLERVQIFLRSNEMQTFLASIRSPRVVASFYRGDRIGKLTVIGETIDDSSFLYLLGTTQDGRGLAIGIGPSMKARIISEQREPTLTP